MEKLQKIKVKKSNGEETEAEVLLCFELEKTGKKYILYTIGRKSDQEMITINAAELKEKDKGYELNTISDDEWKEVKEVMREIIRNEEW